jgi:hypothetical protein
MKSHARLEIIAELYISDIFLLYMSSRFKRSILEARRVHVEAIGL